MKELTKSRLLLNKLLKSGHQEAIILYISKITNNGNWYFKT